MRFKLHEWTHACNICICLLNAEKDLLSTPGFNRVEEGRLLLHWLNLQQQPIENNYETFFLESGEPGIEGSFENSPRSEVSADCMQFGNTVIVSCNCACPHRGLWAQTEKYGVSGVLQPTSGRGIAYYGGHKPFSLRACLCPLCLQASTGLSSLVSLTRR